MDINQRHTPNYLWPTNNRIRVSEQRGIWSIFSSGISRCRSSIMRYWHRATDRSKWERMRKATKSIANSNSLTLIVILIMFILTWIWILIAVTFFGGRLH